jgi:hypothetical protein
VPSSLLLGVTTFLTTDIAAVPMLWVLPLALYLLTFVVAFARRRLVSQRVLLRIQPYLLLPLVINIAVGITASPIAFLPIHVAAFVIAALICHGELARTRPPVRHLTEFYLWISLGGVLGGIFNVVVAPLIFRTVAEYPLALVFAALLRPAESPQDDARSRRRDFLLPVAFGALMFGVLSLYPVEDKTIAVVVVGCLAAVIAFSFSRRPLRFGLALAAILVAGTLTSKHGGRLLVERSFFGVHKIERDPAGYNLLSHGSTLHGAQSLNPAERLEPLMYYTTAGPVGQLFAALPDKARGRNVAIVGLGAGSMVCYGRPGDLWTYYEIDAVVERIARDRRYFTFLSDCPVKPNVVLGDARLTLVRAPAHEYDLIVLDAFSSDAIPIHLMTREALVQYMEKLAPHGVIAFHISNRHLNLQPVLARVAADAGLIGRYQSHDVTEEDKRHMRAPSEWLVLARQASDLGTITSDGRWQALAVDPRVGLWTDDFSNILGIFAWSR